MTAPVNTSPIKTATAFVVSWLLLATAALPANAQIRNPVIGPWGEPAGASSGSTVTTIIIHFWNVLIQVGGLAVLLYFLWGAFEWITAGSDSGQLQAARNRMLHAAVGMVILLGSFVIISFINYLLFGGSFDVLTPTFPTPNGTP